MIGISKGLKPRWPARRLTASVAPVRSGLRLLARVMAAPVSRKPMIGSDRVYFHVSQRDGGAGRSAAHVGARAGRPPVRKADARVSQGLTSRQPTRRQTASAAPARPSRRAAEELGAALRLLARAVAALVAGYLGPAALRLPPDWSPFACLAGSHSPAESLWTRLQLVQAPVVDQQWP